MVLSVNSIYGTIACYAWQSPVTACILDTLAPWVNTAVLYHLVQRAEHVAEYMHRYLVFEVADWTCSKLYTSPTVCGKKHDISSNQAPVMRVASEPYVYDSVTSSNLMVT